jgi:uncharacterized protein (TIGR00369 family)
MELPHREAPLASEQGLDGLLGLELTELSADRVRARLPVRDELRQPLGITHGGVYAAIAESLACRGTDSAVAPAGRAAVGLSNQTNLLRPISQGRILATAVPKHRGRTTWIWEVEFLDDEQRLCALSRVTIAVRDGAPR